MKKYYNFLLGLIPLVFAPFIISCSNSGNPPDIVNNYGGKYQILQESTNSTKTVMKFTCSTSLSTKTINDVENEISSKERLSWSSEQTTDSNGESTYLYILSNYKETEKFKLFIMNHNNYANYRTPSSDPIYLNLADINFNNIENNCVIGKVTIIEELGYSEIRNPKYVTVSMNFEPKNGFKWENSNWDYSLIFETKFQKPYKSSN